MGIFDWIGLEQYAKEEWDKKLEALTKYIDAAKSKETKDIAALILYITYLIKN